MGSTVSWVMVFLHLCAFAYGYFVDNTFEYIHIVAGIAWIANARVSELETKVAYMRKTLQEDKYGSVETANSYCKH